MERILNIAKLRYALDDAGIDAPIHVFGALDPVSSGAYFIAGAEIFDGLTWLRYSYDDQVHVCVYHSNHGWLNAGIDSPQERLEVANMCHNTEYLRNFQGRLKTFIGDASEDLEVAFSRLPHSDLLRHVHNTIKTTTGRNK